MQKKFWSLLLSMAMIVSCFSGLALASGGQATGKPATLLQNPTSVTLDMDSTSNVNVVVNSSNQVSLQGTVLARGTDGNNIVMNSSAVDRFVNLLTGGQVTSDRLVIGAVDSTGYTNSWNPNTNAASHYVYNSSFATSASTQNPFMINRFTQVWDVDASGNFSFQFNPEVHTTLRLSFALNSTLTRIPVSGIVYGVFERAFGGSTNLGADTVMQGKIEALIDALDEAQSVSDSAKTSVAASMATYNAVDTAISSIAGISTDLNAWLTEFDDVLEALEAAAPASGSQYVYGSISFSTDSSFTYDSTAADSAASFATGTLSKADAAYAALNALANDAKDAASTIATGLNATDWSSIAAGSITALQNQVIILSTLIEDEMPELETVDSAVYASVKFAIDEYSKVLDTLSAILYATEFTDLSSSAADIGSLDFANSISDLAAAVDLYNADGSQTVIETVKDLLDLLADTGFSDIVTEFANFQSKHNLTTPASADYANLQDALNDLYDLWDSYAAVIGGANNPITPMDRYLQRTAFTVKFKYKLAESAASFTTGTSGNIWLNNQLVTADGEALANEISFVVRQGGQTLATGTTVNGGKFNIAVTPNGSGDIELIPTMRWARVPGQTGYQRVDLDWENPNGFATFTYTLASFTRKTYNTASLTENSLISNIEARQLIIDELYTVDVDSKYDVKTNKSSFTNVEVKLYGASYAVYNMFDQPIVRQYYVDSDYDVTHRFVWGAVGDTPFIFDVTEAANGTSPSFSFTTAGVLTTNPVNYSTQLGTQEVKIQFASSGNASMRIRSTGTATTQTTLEATETYNVVLPLSVEAPGQVTVVSGNELKKIDVVDKKPTIVQLYMQDTADEVKMTRISYDGKTDLKHDLVKVAKADAANKATGTTLTYYIENDRIYIHLPWDLVTVGGSDIRISLEFAKGNSTVTSREVVVKNLLWNIDTDKDILTVAKNNSLTAVVTDENDVEQNRAMVKVDYPAVNLTNPLKRNDNPNSNVTGGRYTLSNVNPRTGGDLYVFAQEKMNVETSDVKALKVLQALGTNDLTAALTEGYDKVVTGLKKSLRFHVENNAGANETNLVGAQVLSLDGVTKNTNFAKYEDITVTHSGSGNYSVDLVNLKPGSYILRVYTSNMEHYTDIEFEALPLLIETPDDFVALTWDTYIRKNSSFYNANKMTFTVKDPLNNNPVLVEIKNDLEFVKENGEESENGVVLMAKASDDGNVYLSDKDFLPYSLAFNKADHEFWVGVVDERSLVVRNEEGDLSLKFTFWVRENNSTGERREVEGMVIPIALATITATPDTVVTGQKTDITLTVNDANGRPAWGVYVRGDTEGALSAPTNRDGQTVYTFTPVTSGFVKRFDVDGFYDRVFTTVTVVDYSSDPVITLNPYISRTNKTEIVLTGTVSDEIALSSFSIDNGLASSVLTGRKSFDFSVRIPLNLGSNSVRITVVNSNGAMTEKVITIVRDSQSVVTLTIGSTETTGVTGLDVEPQVVNGRTMLPIRFIFQNVLKGIVDYQDGVITASVGEHVIVMVVGSTEATIDGARVTLLSAPFITDEGRTLAPIREILEAIGVTVVYNESLQTVTLYGAGDIDEITDTDLVAPVQAVPPVGTVDDDDTDDVDTGDVDTDDVVDTDDIDNTDEVEEGDE